MPREERESNPGVSTGTAHAFAFEALARMTIGFGAPAEGCRTGKARGQAAGGRTERVFGSKPALDSTPRCQDSERRGKRGAAVVKGRRLLRIEQCSAVPATISRPTGSSGPSAAARSLPLRASGKRGDSPGAGATSLHGAPYSFRWKYPCSRSGIHAGELSRVVESTSCSSATSLASGRTIGAPRGGDLGSSHGLSPRESKRQQQPLTRPGTGAVHSSSG